MTSWKAWDERAYLLDTRTILWAMGRSERLLPLARRVISSEALVISVASYLGSDAESQERQLSIADPIFWWNFDSQQFDRVLIAQARAIADGLTLVTIHR